MSQRYLTKSRFKAAYDCPVKIHYLDRPEYGNATLDNEFLKALAQGGFQVGALAKLYYREGIDLEGMDAQSAITRTKQLLKQENVTIFEAALCVDNLLVRVDILEKLGDRINLIEVKSKSFDSSREDFFVKRGARGILGDWEPYVVDVAYQTYVAKKTLSQYSVYPFLYLVDTTQPATVSGIHQRFLLELSDGKTRVKVEEGTTAKTIGKPFLRLIDVAKEVEFVLTEDQFSGVGFEEYVSILDSALQTGSPPAIRVGSFCKACNFRISPKLKKQNLKSGFEECWTKSGRLAPKDLSRPLIFDLWNGRADNFLSKDIIFLDDISRESLDSRTPSKAKEREGWSRSERQWIQVSKVTNGDLTPAVDLDGLRSALSSTNVRYPLHFIDFETTASAIPFHAGLRPYEQIAFQFSHHVMYEDGTIAHAHQHIDMRQGVFPNFDFIRRLRDALSGDKGTIFRYADHENTILRAIRRQLLASSNPEPDSEVLVDFIDSITKPSEQEADEGAKAGDRVMIDLRKIIEYYFYHPIMGGSNSIKKVIPAILQESTLLQEKYSRPVYGKGAKIPSLNFEPKAWIALDEEGKVKDPYKQLDPIHSDFPDIDEDRPLFSDEGIRDGGAAMTAWARMQFTQMKGPERERVASALLRYCELDTLSMVWIMEYFYELLGTGADQ